MPSGYSILKTIFAIFAVIILQTSLATDNLQPGISMNWCYVDCTYFVLSVCSQFAFSCVFNCAFHCIFNYCVSLLDSKIFCRNFSVMYLSLQLFSLSADLH